jgi:protein-tyrosine phosphatase
VFRHFAVADGVHNRIGIDSAGTHAYHIGEAPDSRSVATAATRGFDMTPLRARKVRKEDFHTFDLILAMDREHLAHLSAMRPNDARAEVKMFLDYHPQLTGRDVPDPYYGGAQGFTDVLDMVEIASRALLAEIKRGL